MLYPAVLWKPPCWHYFSYTTSTSRWMWSGWHSCSFFFPCISGLHYFSPPLFSHWTHINLISHPHPTILFITVTLWHPQDSDGKYFICGVHLPDAEKYDGLNERTLSVALGYVVHVVVLLSQLLNLPLRYPLRPYGSTATIKDTASLLLADTARE